MIKKYGRTKIAVSSSRMITKQGGTAREKVKLKDFFKSARDTFDVFAFDQNSDLFAHAPELLEEANNLSRPYYQRSIDEQAWFLSMGSKASGVHFHHHNDGWSYLFYGQKRWFFLKPSKTPSISHVGRISMREWYKKYIYPRLLVGELPDECLQKEGDLMYVPENWWHATVQPYASDSPEYSISVAAQLKQPLTEAGRLWEDGYKLSTLCADSCAKGNKGCQTSLLKAAAAYERLAKIAPDSEANNRLGSLLQSHRLRHATNQRNSLAVSELLAKELLAMHSAVTLSQERNCVMLNDLAGSLLSTGDFTQGLLYLEKCIDLCAGFDSAVNCYMNKHASFEALGMPSEALELLLAEANKLSPSPRTVRMGNSDINV